MRRLLKLVRSIASTTPADEAKIASTFRHVSLLPGQYLAEEVPRHSWFFVEDGFLLAFDGQNNNWECREVFYEGSGWIFPPLADREPIEGQFKLEAIEPSIIYIIVIEDDMELMKAIPSFHQVHHKLMQRSFKRNALPREFFRSNDSEKIKIIATKFPMWLRAPVEELFGLLGLEDELAKSELIAAQQRFRATRHGTVKQNSER
jgi:hypothetical protein